MSMRFMSIPVAVIALLSITTWIAAAESLGVWQFGEGTIATFPAKAGAEIFADTPVTAGASIIRLSLTKAPKSQLMLSPGSEIRLVEEGSSLVVHVDKGVIQGNIEDKGSYSDLHIIGAAINIRITGTLFVVERVKADTDYIALVEGKVEVKLRKEVALALGKEEADGLDLAARQGIGGSITGGLTKVDELNSRPQLPATAARGTSVRDDAMDGSGDWSTDSALDITSDEIMQQALVDNLATEIADQISQQITDDITTQVTNEVVQEIIGGSQIIRSSTEPELGTPPGPPN